MALDWVRYGLIGLAIAAAAFAITANNLGLDLPAVLGFVVQAIGYGLAASRPRGGRLGLGFLLAFLGTLPFFFGSFFPLEMSPFLLAIAFYMGGQLAGAVGGALQNDAGRAAMARWILFGGCLAITAAAAMWIPLDGVTSARATGNILAFVGGALATVGFFRR